jgi:DNA-binding CsgD family transcriptional regulator
LMDPRSIGDPLLAATSLSTWGRYDEAIELIDGSDVRSADESTGWVPIFFEPVTATRRPRILFKAGRYTDAERAAAHALDVWDRSGLGGEGTALRVRAEALEALGYVAPATEAIESAIAALQPLSPVHHMVGAYKCAFRLTKKPAYRNAAGDLIAGLNKDAVSPQGMQLTPREREIALLVTEGKTNRDIGTRLGISRRTVENHVASIFNRLSIRARWQLTSDLLDL